MNFPYTNEEAYYNPLGQFVNMCSYEREEFISKSKEGLDFFSLKYFSTYFHELRHWIDHIGTIWGQHYLIEIYRRFDEILKNKLEEVSILSPFQIHEVLKSESLFQIFNATSSKKNSEIWSMNFKNEVFDKVPFFVLNFSDSSNRKICKSPVTFLSLFETNSIHEEIGLFFSISNSYIKDENQKIAEELNQQKYYFELAYNSDFIEYSAATHIPAYLMQIPNSLIAYSVSSSISTIILNLTSRIIIQISENGELHKLNRFHYHLTVNRDLGYLMYCLTKNYQNQRSSNKFFIEEFLEINQLPNTSELEEEVQSEMENHRYQLKNENYFKSRFLTQIEKGKEIIKLRGVDGKKMSIYRFNQETGIKPKLMFGDDFWELDTYPDLSTKNIMKFSFPEWYNLIEDLTERDKVLRENFI